MADHQTSHRVSVIGHRHPDTDSICSAIAYAWLKNQKGGPEVYEPRRAGELNRETEFVLRYFQVPTPRLCEDVRPQLKDAEYRILPGIDENLTLLEAWEMMLRDDIETLCVTDGAERLLGIISMKDIGQFYMEHRDVEFLGEAHTPLKNLAKTLEAKIAVGNPEDRIERGKVCVGTSPELILENVNRGDIVLVTNRPESQTAALECRPSCVVVCCGADLDPEIAARAEAQGTSVLCTPLDTYAVARIVSMAVPVRFRMLRESVRSFTLETPVEEVRKVMAGVRHRYFPVLDADGRYMGVISRRNLLNPHRKRLILVDHNEKSQAVTGLEEAEILEIVDHHRLGALETGEPLMFRNMPVGCTSTILWRIFGEEGVTPPREIAGLMLSAILSDTLMFRSATCTALDRQAAEALAAIAGVEIPDYAERMFRAGEDLSGRSTEEIVFSDLKEFQLDQLRIAAGQSLFMTDSVFREAEVLIRHFLPEALRKTGADLLYYMLTDTPGNRTRLLCCGEGAEALAEEAFGSAPVDGVLDLEGLVSRKKQLIPPLSAALRRRKERV